MGMSIPFILKTLTKYTNFINSISIQLIQYKLNIEMLNYHQAINAILSIPSAKAENGKPLNEFASNDILNELKLNHKIICQHEMENLNKSKTVQLLAKIITSNNPQLFTLFKGMLQILYLKESPMLKMMYQVLPIILQKFIQSQQNKNPDIQGLVKVIFTNQVNKFSQYLKNRQEINHNSFVRDLYSIHFNKTTNKQGQENQLEKSLEVQQSQSMSLTDKKVIKSILFFTIYRNLDCLNEQQLKQYLKTIYFYCGGDPKTYSNISSFYLLEKKNLFNLFRYSISQQEIEWILLSLYELSIETNKLKFELLAAINMIYKKTANESMFKFSQIAQSVIHILEDEYTDIFS